MRPLLCRLGLHRWTTWQRARGPRLVNITTGAYISHVFERRCTRLGCTTIEGKDRL